MDGFKNSTRVNYLCGGPVKKSHGGTIKEGISTRPTDSSGRRMADEELGMAQKEVKKPMRKNLGAITDREMKMLKKAAPANNDKPMIRRKSGGLAVMPKGK
jgi:hypothetical protein